MSMLWCNTHASHFVHAISLAHVRIFQGHFELNKPIKYEGHVDGARRRFFFSLALPRGIQYGQLAQHICVVNVQTCFIYMLIDII